MAMKSLLLVAAICGASGLEYYLSTLSLAQKADPIVKATEMSTVRTSKLHGDQTRASDAPKSTPSTKPGWVSVSKTLPALNLVRPDASPQSYVM